MDFLRGPLGSRKGQSLAGLTLEKLDNFAAGCGLLNLLPLRGQETKFYFSGALPIERERELEVETVLLIKTVLKPKSKYFKTTLKAIHCVQTKESRQQFSYQLACYIF